MVSRKYPLILPLGFLALWLLAVLLFIQGGFVLPFGPVHTPPTGWKYPLWQVFLASLGALLEVGWLFWGFTRRARLWQAVILGIFMLWAGLWIAAGITTTGGNSLLIAHSLWMLLVMVAGLAALIGLGLRCLVVLFRQERRRDYDQ
jgi:hypothetical protein